MKDEVVQFSGFRAAVSHLSLLAFSVVKNFVCMLRAPSSIDGSYRRDAERTSANIIHRLRTSNSNLHRCIIYVLNILACRIHRKDDGSAVFRASQHVGCRSHFPRPGTAFTERWPCRSPNSPSVLMAFGIQVNRVEAAHPTMVHYQQKKIPPGSRRIWLFMVGWITRFSHSAPAVNHFLPPQLELVALTFLARFVPQVHAGPPTCFPRLFTLPEAVEQPWQTTSRRPIDNTHGRQSPPSAARNNEKLIPLEGKTTRESRDITNTCAHVTDAKPPPGSQGTALGYPGLSTAVKQDRRGVKRLNFPGTNG
jgi:hypothetical protein